MTPCECQKDHGTHLRAFRTDSGPVEVAAFCDWCSGEVTEQTLRAQEGRIQHAHL